MEMPEALIRVGVAVLAATLALAGCSTTQRPTLPTACQAARDALSSQLKALHNADLAMNDASSHWAESAQAFLDKTITPAAAAKAGRDFKVDKEKVLALQKEVIPSRLVAAYAACDKAASEVPGACHNMFVQAEVLIGLLEPRFKSNLAFLDGIEKFNTALLINASTPLLDFNLRAKRQATVDRLSAQIGVSADKWKALVKKENAQIAILNTAVDKCDASL